MNSAELEHRWASIEESGRPAELRVAVLSTFTAQPIVPHLGMALEDEGLPTDIWVGPFDQIAQECLDSESETSRFAPNVLLVWPRWEDVWGQMALPLTAGEQGYAEAILPIVDAATTGARRMKAQLIFVNPSLPEARPLGVGDATNPFGVSAQAEVARTVLRRRLAETPTTLLFDLEEIVRTIGASNAYDLRMAALARMPFSQALLARAGLMLGRLLRIARRAPKKVVVVDGDRTLWGGIIGEDGVDGVDLRASGPGSAFIAFQRYLRELRRSGVLLALASKNDERDVWAVFERAEMQLKREDLAAWRIGWQPKSESIRQMAEELNLGLDSFVFIDDNPAELAEVGAALPMIERILMPADPVHWLDVIQGAGVLDRRPPTSEDLDRAAFYQQDGLRKISAARASSIEEYLASLEVKVAIFEPGSNDLQRFAQLVSKTNQFNLSGLRLTEQELAERLADGHHVGRLVSATDRFGDYGVIGAFLLRRVDPGTKLELFLLSCRAMGRGIETAMVSAMFEELGPTEEITASVVTLPRNEPARKFFASLGCGADAASLKRVSWPTHVSRVVTSD